MTKSTVKCAVIATLAAAAPLRSDAARNGGPLDLLKDVQLHSQRVAKQDIWLEDRSAGRLQNTRGHLAPAFNAAAFDHWQGYYSAEVAAFSC